MLIRPDQASTSIHSGLRQPAGRRVEKILFHCVLLLIAVKADKDFIIVAAR